MYTQTLYELSQEAERLLQLSRQQLQLLEKMPLSVPGDDAPHFPTGNGAGDCRYHESREINHH